MRKLEKLQAEIRIMRNVLDIALFHLNELERNIREIEQEEKNTPSVEYQPIKQEFEYHPIPKNINNEKVQGNRRMWTKKDVNWLKLFYKSYSNNEIAIIMNRTQKSIDHKAHMLGLKKHHNEKGLD